MFWFYNASFIFYLCTRIWPKEMIRSLILRRVFGIKLDIIGTFKKSLFDIFLLKKICGKNKQI